MLAHQQFPCWLFKKRLLRVMETKFNEQPQYRLFYARTLVEAFMHKRIAQKGTEPTADNIIEEVRLCEVSETD